MNRETDQAIGKLRGLLARLPKRHPERGRLLVDLGVALLMRYSETGEAADLDEAIVVNQRAVRAVRQDLQLRAAALANLGLALSARYESTGDLTVLAESDRACTEAAELLAAMGEALREHHARTGTQRSLEQAEKLFRQALSLVDDESEAYLSHLTGLALVLNARFNITPDRAVLDECVECQRLVLARTPSGDPNRAGALSNLANALGTLFRFTDRLEVLDEAIGLHREAITVARGTSRHSPALRSNLATALRSRYNRTGELAWLAESVQTLREVVTSVGDGNPHLTLYLSNLGASLVAYNERSGDVAALSEAVDVLRRALERTPTGHPDHLERLSDLGAALALRHERTVDLAALREAVDLMRVAVAMTGEHDSGLAGRLSDLGLVLKQLSIAASDPGALDEAVDVGRRAVAAAPDNRAELARCQSNLGTTLSSRYDRSGRLRDLDEAVEAARRAVAAVPSGHPREQDYLSNLSNMLRKRYEHNGELSALDEAVQAARRAVEASPAGHADRVMRVANLGQALMARYERAPHRWDLDEAIATVRQALDDTPADHPDRIGGQANLANALMRKYRRTGDEASLAEATALYRAAAAALPDGHPGQGRNLSNLVYLLTTRYRLRGEDDALDEAIEAARRAARITPTQHVDRARVLLTVGAAFQAQYRRAGDRAVLQEALAAFAEAADSTTASTATRAKASAAYGRLALSAGNADRADEALGRAVELLPLVAARHLARGDAEYWLGEFAGLAADAAAAAITAGRPRRAVSLLEQGRGVLVSQAIEARTDLTELRGQAPELAERFEWLCAALDADDAGEPGTVQAPGGPGSRRQELATELDGLMGHIRQLRGLEQFLLPPDADVLAAQTVDGPVVYVNPSAHRCDALILTPDGVQVVPLPELESGAVERRVRAFSAALQVTSDPQESAARRIQAELILRQTLGWLWDAVADPVLGALGLAEPPTDGGPWPRLWWAPGGWLTFLPLHAAGYHDGSGRAVLDRVVSSYIPTMRALGYARSRRRVAGQAPQTVAVVMPRTPGAADLPGTEREAALLRKRFPEATVLLTEQATHEAVLRELHDSTIAHFACHAYSDPYEPAASRLLVHDHAERPLTVLDVSRLRLPGAQLAFLSACATARATRNLADEAVHIATAFQLAGYPHVIGTLWPIDDAIAVTVADEVYEYLTVSDGGIDFALTAEALHRATRKVRVRYGHTPSWWAAHVHAGA